MCFLFVRIATDIFDQKLEKAKIMGADVVVNGRIDNLKDIGEFEIFLINLVACCWVDFLVIYKASLCVLQSLGNIVASHKLPFQVINARDAGEGRRHGGSHAVLPFERRGKGSQSALS